MSVTLQDQHSFITTQEFARMLGITRWKADRIMKSGAVTVRQFPGCHPEVLLADAESLARRCVRPATVAG